MNARGFHIWVAGIALACLLSTGATGQTFVAPRTLAFDKSVYRVVAGESVRLRTDGWGEGGTVPDRDDAVMNNGRAAKARASKKDDVISSETTPTLRFPPMVVTSGDGRVDLIVPPATPPGSYEVSLKGATDTDPATEIQLAVEPVVAQRAARNGSVPVILLNGWQVCLNRSSSVDASVETFGRLASLLQSDGIPVLYFNNCAYGDTSIDELGSQLGAYIAGLRYPDGTPVDEVDLVAHSMGGLISRAYLAGIRASGSGWWITPPVSTRVRKLVQIATPNFGSFWAANVGTQLSQMFPGSSFLWTLATWNQRGDDLRGVDMLAIVGNAASYQDVPATSDGVVSLASASLGFVADPNRTRILPYCHTNNSLLPCSRSGGIANVDQAPQTGQIVRSFLAGSGEWRTIGKSAADDPYLGQYGGLYFGVVDTGGRYLADVSSARWDSFTLRSGGATGATFYGELYKGTGLLSFARSNGSSGTCGSATPPRGTYGVIRCKYGPIVSSVGPLSSKTGTRSVLAGAPVTLAGVGFGTTRCSTCGVWVGSNSLQVNSWNDQAVSVYLPAGYVGLTQLALQASGGSDFINVMVETPPVSPSIGSITNGASFLPGAASMSWVTITGTNLSRSTRIWRAEDIVLGRILPTSLDGVQVNINGKPTVVYYISPTQLNILTPVDETGTADIQVEVEVITPDGSARATTLKKRFAPGLFMFDPENRRYVSSYHADGTLVAKTGLFPGLGTLPARPGETVSLFLTGMGVRTESAVASGQVLLAPTRLLDTVTASIGGVPANVTYAGMIVAGVYQVNVTIPQVSNGDNAVSISIGGTNTSQAAYITVAHQ